MEKLPKIKTKNCLDNGRKRLNDPINLVDPYGLSAKDALKGLHFGIRATGAVTNEVARIVTRDVAFATTSAYLNIPFAN